MWPVTSNTTLPTFTFTASSDAVAEHEKFGRLLGAQFSKVIRERFASKASLRRLVELAKSQPELYNSFLTLHETAFPKYLAELRGIATGAVVDFNQVFLQSAHANCLYPLAALDPLIHHYHLCCGRHSTGVQPLCGWRDARR